MAVRLVLPNVLASSTYSGSCHTCADGAVESTLVCGVYVSLSHTQRGESLSDNLTDLVTELIFHRTLQFNVQSRLSVGQSES